MVYGHFMIDLDDVATYEQLDPSGLYRRIDTVPEQCRHAWLQAKNIVTPSNLDRCTEIIIAGMGGSAIAGDLGADLRVVASLHLIRLMFLSLLMPPLFYLIKRYRLRKLRE